ncbi:hypothetical protein BB561_005378 [Smittium simulii]|uniref:Coronin n=1 Tax=Smittium simulii TaxID=133385 RepID=A0A2T9YAN4_9FUNG|nr:hypothetical protein BB561_005378 [Smittium simulii]
MHSFVRASKYRHVFGTAFKRDECYDNLRISINAWDTNYITVNSKYMAVNWNAGGGGAFGVVPLSTNGRLHPYHPLFTGHNAQVTDTDFSPFNDDIIASVAEDSKLRIWSINEDQLLHYPKESNSSSSEENVVSAPQHFETPLRVLTGHTKKIGHTMFNPVVENVIATSSADQSVRLWDVEYGSQKACVEGFNDNILSFSWNYDGSLIAATSRDKNFRLLDPRTEQIVSSAQSHLGIKGSRAIWLGDSEKLLTTGFNRSSGREVFLWDSKNFSKPILKMEIDISSGVLMPFYDSGSNMLYLAGKGDGNIRYYEYKDGQLHYLSEYKSAEPQRGMCAMPKLGLNFSKFELMRLYKITASNVVEPISFQAPRKGDAFLPDLYPPTPGPYPALSSSDYFSGKTSNPILVDLESVFEGKPPKVVSPNDIKKADTPITSPIIRQSENKNIYSASENPSVEKDIKQSSLNADSNPFTSSKTQKLLNMSAMNHVNDTESNIKSIPLDPNGESELLEKLGNLKMESSKNNNTADVEAIFNSTQAQDFKIYKEEFDLKIQNLQLKIEELENDSSKKAIADMEAVSEKDKHILELKQMIENQAQEHADIKNSLNSELSSLQSNLDTALAQLQYTQKSVDQQSSRVSELEAQLTKTINAAIGLVSVAEKLQ